MAYGDEKVVIDLKEGERGSIMFRDKSGAERTYYPARWANFIVENLQTLVVLNQPLEGQKEPIIIRRIRGTARLEDRSLSVVGDAESATKTVEMSFEASEWRPKQGHADDEHFFSSLSGFVGGASLSFNRHDWQIGNDDEWWAACYLPAAYVEQLEAAIASGQLRSVRVGLSLRGLYSDDGDWAPVSSRSNLFIRPNRSDNSLKIPDLARGFVSSIHFTTTKADLRDVLVDGEETPKPDEAEPNEPRPDQVTLAIAALAPQIETLRVTLKWVGGLIVVALFLLAGR